MFERVLAETITFADEVRELRSDPDLGLTGPPRAPLRCP